MVCTGILTVLLSPATSLAATCDQSGAKAMAVEGKVDVRHPEETQWQPVKLHDTFCPGDVIRVQERSRADIALSNQPMLRLDQNTTMTLGGIKKEGGSLIELVKGATHFFSRVPRNLEVRTAFVNAGVEGTEGVIRVTEDKTEITIFEGKVVAANEEGTLSITNGQSVVAEKGKALSYQTVVKPRDAVQWALYYPPVMDVSPDAAVKEDDPRSLVNRAASSLAVGRVDEANADLDRALKLDPKNSDALALQSVIAVVQNDKDKALTLAQQAVAADPNSTSAKMALSYAQQARFDLDGARKTLEEEVKAHPNNALAWARLAELRASFSELDGALEAAQKAVALNPNLSRTQTVLGFAYLLEVKTTEAKAAFAKAIELDQADAMPRLGLGLAKFREGHVEEGRREMEVAASLDPNNSMIRSYLGKAYFEEKRDDMTEREYKNAKELDPKDPTPFFYDALQKQLTNRPVEALQDMEKAIELNKNRAVYRSNLAMDSDAAARSASLGRIYNDLQFQYLGLLEGWSSVNSDPTSFTAHRLLADTYSTLQRHEIARVSELLVSQLLQPLNITPIQPSQAESNLFLIASLGPTATSFNEFNTLMVNRDRTTFQGSVLAGERGTFGQEGIVAGIYKNMSYSLGASNYTTNGWRNNAEQDDLMVNAFMQVELSSRTSVQFEYRNRKLDRGDTRLRFFEQDYFPLLQQTENRNVYRMGLRHNFTPDSILLGSFIYQNAATTLTDNSPPLLAATGVSPTAAGLASVILNNPNDAMTGELQHQFRSRYLNLVTGGSLTSIVSTVNAQIALDPTGFGLPPGTILVPPANIIASRDGADLTHGVVYGYSYIRPLQNITVTLGVSADFRSGEDQTMTGKAQVNPKFGLLWNPLPDTLVRLGAFREMKRPLVANQTLEPTQVAGFNQFFDDINGTTAWRYTAGLNQKVTRNFVVGGEGSIRDSINPVTDFTDPANPTVKTLPWHEYQARAYAFLTPHEWVALRAEFQWDRMLRDQQLTDGALTVNTYRVPLGARVFHPSGLGAFVTETFVKQDGTFTGPLDDNSRDGSTNFWLLDAGLTYRLPKRYGLLTIGGTNLTNEKFNYYDQDFTNTLIQPARMVFAKLTLALP
jgi:tetratricopeptide (TPR) repeat protein